MRQFLRPSERSTKLWGDLVAWPLRVELAIVVLSILALALSIAFCIVKIDVRTIWAEHDFVYGDMLFTFFDIAIFILPPAFALIPASVDIWLYHRRALAPSIVLTTSIIMLVGWGTAFFWWFPRIYGFQMRQYYIALATFVEINAGLEMLLNFIYIVFAARAVHRHRKFIHAEKIPNSEPAIESRVASEYELELRVISHSEYPSRAMSGDDVQSRHTSLPSYVPAPPSYRSAISNYTAKSASVRTEDLSASSIASPPCTLSISDSAIRRSVDTG